MKKYLDNMAQPALGLAILMITTSNHAAMTLEQQVAHLQK